MTGSSKGAYSIELSWSAINQAQEITFIDDEERTFVAQFFDSEGRKATKSLSIGLTCDGESACTGTCVDLSADLDNCGGCGRSCPSAGGEPRACHAGACLVAEGTTPRDCTGPCKEHGLVCAAACQFYGSVQTDQAQIAW